MAQGFTRFRKIQVGKQSVIGTAVPATRVLPYRSLVVYNPNRTDPDIDVGSLDPVLSPYPVAPEVTLPGGRTGFLIFVMIFVPGGTTQSPSLYGWISLPQDHWS